MNFDESAKNLIDVSRQAKVDIQPLVEAVDGIIGIFADVTKNMDFSDNQLSELIRQAMFEIHSVRDEFVEVASTDLEQLHKETMRLAQESADTLLEIGKARDESLQSLAQLEADLPAMMEKARNDLLGTLPPAPEPISINPGEELVARLMELGAPAKPPSKTMPSPGNIWENWKPGQGAS